MQGKRIPLITFVLTLLAVALLAGRSAFAAEHKIARGDSLNITVVGEPEYSRAYKVSDEGKIMLPQVGNVVVHGKTVTEATKDIEKRLSIILKKPIVLIDVTSYVMVSGMVNNSSPIAIQPDARLSYYLKQAGVKQDDADLTKGTIVRAGQKDPISVDLKAVLNATDPSKDIVVLAGDTIWVPAKDKDDSVDGKLKVLGEVLQPGEKDYKSNLTPLEAVTTLAGGFKPGADKTRVVIRHKDTSQLTVDMAAVERGEGDPMAPVIVLQDGDSVFVPNAEGAKVDVAGLGIKTPGKIAYEPGMHVMDAILKAGSFTDDANKEAVNIHRKDGQTVPVNLDRYLREGDITQNVILEQGDTILVGTANSETSQIEVTGLGIKTPGKVAYEPGMRVVDAITKAGGFTETARMKEVSVIHKEGKPVKVNFEKLMNNADLTQNVPLQKGDIVMVGTEKPKSNSGKSDIFGPLLSTITSALIYRSIWR